MNDGGSYIMYPLVLLAMILWYALGYRFHTLKRGSKKYVRPLIRKFATRKRENPRGLIDGAIVEGLRLKRECHDPKILRGILEDAFFKYKQQLKTHAKAVRTIVVVAPLIGLLGTVIGMIETFDSLASMTLFSQSGGIAGGISQALFTTQLGLVVAVPGLVIGRLLDKRADNMELDLEQIKDILCSEENLHEI